MVQSEAGRLWAMLQLPTAPPEVDLKSGGLPPLGLLKVVANIRLGFEGSTAMLGSDCWAASALLARGIMSMMLMVWAQAIRGRPPARTRAAAPRVRMEKHSLMTFFPGGRRRGAGARRGAQGTACGRIGPGRTERFGGPAG